MKEKILYKLFLILLFCAAGTTAAAAKISGVSPEGSGLVNTVKLEPADTPEQVTWKAAHVTPTRNQYNWQQLEYTMFVHFGMNTFSNVEWGEGTENPKSFNPLKFDARQWAQVARDSGMKMIIVTAKHHDGFCLWPSRFTEHSVKNSPWRDGKGDVVKEVSEAARAAGLKFGFYLSPWDRHEATFGTPAYDEYYLNQLRELLTNYGEVSEVWMDGACGSMDPRCEGVKYAWDRIFPLIRELQPNAVLSIYGPDVRWVGNEAGGSRKQEWSVIPIDSAILDYMGEDLGSREVLLGAAKSGATLRWYPAQTDTSVRPGWFYHPGEDYMVKPVEKLVDLYLRAVGGNSQLLLNVPPGPDGLIHKNDWRILKKVWNIISKMFDKNIAAGANAVANTSRGDQLQYAAGNAVDGDYETYWMTHDGVEGAEVVLDLRKPEKFNILVLQEQIMVGQRIEEFALDAEVDGAWKEVARGETVGYKKILHFDAVTARRARLRILRSRVAPAVSEIGLFFSDYFDK